MELLSLIALIMLVMVGYSAGATAVFRGRHLPPAIFDLLVVAAIWIIALLFREAFGRWLSVLIWTVVAGVVAFAIMRLRHGRFDQPIDPPTPVSNLFRRLWNGWSWFAAHMGNFQGRLLMAFFYFTAVLPFGLIARANGRMLPLTPPGSSSAWTPRETAVDTLEEAKQQG